VQNPGARQIGEQTGLDAATGLDRCEGDSAGLAVTLQAGQVEVQGRHVRARLALVTRTTRSVPVSMSRKRACGGSACGFCSSGPMIRSAAVV